MAADTKRWAVGDTLPTLTKQMTIKKMKTPVWSANNPVHYDPEYARAAGLPGPIATGEMSTSYLSELLTSVFGPAWIAHSRLKSRYLAPVFAGDTVTVGGRITERVEESGRLRIGTEVWCENQHGQKVTVGTATVWLDAEGGP